MKTMIAVTMGDPAGIGPEIGIKALTHPEVLDICRPVLIGSPGVILDGLKTLGVSKKISLMESPGENQWIPDRINLIPIKNSTALKPFSGRPSPEGGLASLEAVKIAADLTRKKVFRAMVTGPVNKAAINSAGVQFSGHTEFLAEYFGSTDFGMLMVVPPRPGEHQGLRVMLATTHIALRDLSTVLSPERIFRTIQLGNDAMLGQFALESPRIAVAGLNPHGGENGLFGDEEVRVIRPAVEKARAKKIPVTGPLPADTLFHRAFNGEFDLVIAMYHDQALIPVKLLGFHRSVNFTVGLPVIRTSVDHGTGYDLAGKGLADPGSLIEAIRLGVRLNPGT